jgi:ribosomal protein L11 methyltransferase
VSVRVTVPCTRAQGELIAHADDFFPDSPNPPVLVADEPDESKPDDWLIHAYFEHPPTRAEIATLPRVAAGRAAR